MPKINNVLAEWDSHIDEWIDDARGFHETVQKMNQDKYRERAAEADPDFRDRQVDDAADEYDAEADEDEGLSGGGGRLVIVVPARRAPAALVIRTASGDYDLKLLPPGAAVKVPVDVGEPCTVGLYTISAAARSAGSGVVRLGRRSSNIEPRSSRRRRRRKNPLNP